MNLQLTPLKEHPMGWESKGEMSLVGKQGAEECCRKWLHRMAVEKHGCPLQWRPPLHDTCPMWLPSSYPYKVGPQRSAEGCILPVWSQHLTPTYLFKSTLSHFISLVCIFLIKFLDKICVFQFKKWLLPHVLSVCSVLHLQPMVWGEHRTLQKWKDRGTDWLLSPSWDKVQSQGTVLNLKMEEPQSCSCRLVSVGLKDAYWPVSIHQKFWHFLIFFIGSRCYQIKIHFGLNITLQLSSNCYTLSVLIRLIPFMISWMTSIHEQVREGASNR